MKNSTAETISRSVRLIVGVIGGYIFANGLIAIAGVGLHKLYFIKSEALMLAVLLGFLSYLFIILWVVVTRRLILVSSAIISLAALMFIVSPMLVQS